MSLILVYDTYRPVNKAPISFLSIIVSLIYFEVKVSPSPVMGTPPGIQRTVRQKAHRVANPSLLVTWVMFVITMALIVKYKQGVSIVTATT